MGERKLGVEEQEVEVDWGGRHEGGREGEQVGHRLGGGHHKRDPRSSSWTADSDSLLLTCRNWW